MKINEPVNEVYYTLFGKHDRLDAVGNPILTQEDPEKQLAKAVELEDGSIQYLVKFDSDGGIFNPFDQQFSIVNRRNKLLGRDEQWKFQKVNSRCFEFYLNFLKTQKESWISHAEKEIV